MTSMQFFNLPDFIDWLRGYSHRVGYWRTVYLYSKGDGGKQAKRLLKGDLVLD